MSLQNTYEKIENYLNGTLTGADLEAFEEQLQSDAELLEEVKLMQNLDTVLSDEVDLVFQQMVETEAGLFLDELGSEEVEQPNFADSPVPKIGGWNRKWAIAASFLLLMVSMVLLWQVQSNDPISNDALFANHFDTYRLNKNVRGGGDSPTEFQKGIEYYNANEFGAATQVFEALTAQEPNDLSLAFCLGNAYLNQEPPQLDLAQSQFEKIISDGGSIHVPKAQWYMALVAVKKGDLEQAKTLLKQVEQSGDKFGQKAKELLKELE
ncbi:MAG: tol-pal system YbgF family protein [Chitinophagales bacterium]